VVLSTRTRSTRLVLIRHGHTAANGSPGGMRLSGWTDTPLSAEGEREAALVAEALRDHPPFAALYTSPLRRARHTAIPIEEAIGATAVVAPGLREIHCGQVDGRSVEHVRQHYPAAWLRNAEQADDQFRWPGGESYREFRARSLRAVRAIAARHPGETVAIVTHAGVITQILGWIHGISAARWSAFRPRNASISAVDWSTGLHAILAFDAHAHLETFVPGRATSHRHAG
jgi:broad specificity phosphatase PhoE